MQIALNDVLKDDGKILRVDADFGPDTFEMKLGKYPITRKTPVSLVLTNKGKLHGKRYKRRSETLGDAKPHFNG